MKSVPQDSATYVHTFQLTRANLELINRISRDYNNSTFKDQEHHIHIHSYTTKKQSKTLKSRKNQLQYTFLRVFTWNDVVSINIRAM